MKIARTTRKIATDFYSKYEHLGNVGQGVWHYALINNCDEVLGVESFGHLGFRPSQSAIFRDLMQGFPTLGFYQLCRGACVSSRRHCFSSYALARAIRQFRMDIGPCVIVAYADESFCEIGTIYQACNALYLGLTNPKGQSNYSIRGTVYSAWSVRRRYGTRNIERLRKIEPTVRRITLQPKHRYAIIATPRGVKRRLSRELAPYCLPYPKRENRGIPHMKIDELIRKRA